MSLYAKVSHREGVNRYEHDWGVEGTVLFCTKRQGRVCFIAAVRVVTDKCGTRRGNVMLTLLLLIGVSH